MIGGKKRIVTGSLAWPQLSEWLTVQQAAPGSTEAHKHIQHGPSGHQTLVLTAGGRSGSDSGSPAGLWGPSGTFYSLYSHSTLLFGWKETKQCDIVRKLINRQLLSSNEGNIFTSLERKHKHCKQYTALTLWPSSSAVRLKGIMGHHKLVKRAIKAWANPWILCLWTIFYTDDEDDDDVTFLCEACLWFLQKQKKLIKADCAALLHFWCHPSASTP